MCLRIGRNSTITYPENNGYKGSLNQPYYISRDNPGNTQYMK